MDITLPAFDTPRSELTPLVLAAMADGATSAPHATDPLSIVLSFEDEEAAQAFLASIDAVLNPKPARK